MASITTVLIGCLVLLNFPGQPLPLPMNTDLVETGSYNYTNSYIQFFKVQELIEKINIKRFRDLHHGPEIVEEESTEILPEDFENPGTITEIDLTDEAIINDKVTVVDVSLVSEEVIDANDIVIAEEIPVIEDVLVIEEVPIELPGGEIIVEEIPIIVEEVVVEEIPDGAGTHIIEDIPLESTTLGIEDSQVVEVNQNVEDAPAIDVVPQIEEESIAPLPVGEDADLELNTIDTGSDNLIVSKKTAENAKKFGYKILLKKVGNEEVPVVQIKFALPTDVEIAPIVDLPNDGVTIEENEVEEDTISEEKETDIDQNLVEVGTVSEGGEDIEEVNIAAVADLREDKEEEAINENIVEQDEVEETTVLAVIEETTTIREINLKVEEVSEADDTITATEAVETITAPSALYQPPPIMAVLPTIEVIDEETIVDGVMKIKEDTETAIEEIISLNETEGAIVFPSCSAPVEEVKAMLTSLALSVVQSTPLLGEIITTAQALKDETNMEELARGGGKLLMLLEPFLDSLLPATQAVGCAGESSNAMLMSLTGMATKLDILAEQQDDPVRAAQLHESATSLQLAAWVMAQLQTSVHTFYTPEGLCGSGKSSAVAILGSLSKAMSGYIPILALMGNQNSLDELVETITSLDNATNEISRLEGGSGLLELPGVECGASFSDMGRALQELADFIHALPVNN